MALKRKASFTTVVSPRSSFSSRDSSPPSLFLSCNVATIDETPRHLHSRTRKRFRNDRPDDQTVYDNTLRWLFSAQQQQQQHVSSPISCSPGPTAENPSTPFTSTIDPSQHTLRRFFQPLRASSPTIPTRMDLGSSFVKNNMTLEAQCVDFTMCAGNLESGLCMSESISSNPRSDGMDIDIDMQMEIDSAIDIPSPSIGGKKWVGGIGWM